MARMGILLGLDNLLISKDENIKEDLKKFKNSINLNSRFDEFVRDQANVPKIISDLWESFSAFLVLQGGWQLLYDVYGKIYVHYIAYLVKFQQNIQWNVYDEL